VSDSATAPFDWRSHLPVHPAAEAFPVMSETDPQALKELAEDIKQNGLKNPIVLAQIAILDESGKRTDVYAHKLLDGRNRLDALALLGWLEAAEKPKKASHYGRSTTYAVAPIKLLDGEADDSININDDELFTFEDVYDDDSNLYSISASLNVHRRHLTQEMKRELIAQLLRLKPEQSNRAIGKQAKADDKTVASVRREMESTAEIPQLEKTVGADGKARKQPSKKVTVNGQPIAVGPTLEQIAVVVAPAPETIAEAVVEMKPPEQNNVAVALEQIVEPITAPPVPASLEACSQGIGSQMQEAVADLSKEDAADLLEILGDTIQELKNEIGIEDKVGNDPLEEFKRACNKWLPRMTEEERKQARVHHMEWKPKLKRKAA
jgi:ParB-like chromosome segregation protein Spo0J